MNKLFTMIFLVGSLLVMGANINQAQAASVSFGSEGKMFAPNCFCKTDVKPYNLAPWCEAKNSCNGETNTQSINVSDGDYRVKINLGGLTDSQKYEVVILTMNGRDYTIPDQGGNSSSTGTAVYDLGTLHLSGNISFKATHKYANTFTGKWYSSEASKIGSGNAMESISVDSIVLDRIDTPTPPPPPVTPAPTCAISVNPDTINSGDSSTLKWSSTNATSFAINQGIGNVATSGTKSVSPIQITTYTGTATGAGGTAVCNTTIKVNVLQPAIKITKDDNDNGDDNQTVDKNGTATFKITVTNTGNANLKDVVISDQLAPNCNRSAAQTKSLYTGDFFALGGSFSYTCTDTSIGESYVNTAIVTGTTQNDSQNVSDNDKSSVTVKDTPPPTPDPTPDPKPEPKKDKCEGTIGNYVWLDANGDGVQDKSEKGLSGISIKLKKDNGKLVDKETTNKKGEYEFDDLCEGDYTVYVNDEDVASYTQTFDPDGKKNNQTDVELEGSHDSHTKADFGYNKSRVTPATGPGMIALYLAGLVSLIGLLSYKQLKQRFTPSLEKQFKRLIQQ